MAINRVSDLAFLYKRKYSDDKLADQTRRDHLLQEMATVRQGCGGADFRYVVRFANPQGVSSTFASGQTHGQSAQGGSSGVQFACEPALKYGFVNLDGPAMARSEGDDNAFYELVTGEVDGSMQEVGDRLAYDLYRDGGGSRGRRSSISTNTVTLTNADDARNFKVNMKVTAGPNADGTSLRSGSTYVVKRNIDAGTVELNDASAIASFANNDYLFAIGDEGTVVDGLEAIIPLTAPSASDSFRGVNRSVDTRALAGCRVDDTSTPILESAGLVSVKIRQEGGRSDCCFLNPINFWKVVRERDAKVEYTGGGGTADYGFQFVNIALPGGVVKLYSDPDCPTNRGYVGLMSTLHLRAIKKYTHTIVDGTGQPAMRMTSEDGIEIRTRSMTQPVITIPKNWGVFSI